MVYLKLEPNMGTCQMILFIINTEYVEGQLLNHPIHSTICVILPYSLVLNKLLNPELLYNFITHLKSYSLIVYNHFY